MAACSFCGAALAPGATFCRACGTAVTPEARTSSGPSAPAPRRPSPGAAIAVASLPVTAALFFLWIALMPRGPFGAMGFRLEFFLLPMSIAAVALPIAWALWRGRGWGAPLGILGALAWGGFTAWAAFDALEAIQRQPASFARSQTVPAVLFAFSQALACAVALALLGRDLLRRYRQSRTS